VEEIAYVPSNASLVGSIVPFALGFGRETSGLIGASFDFASERSFVFVDVRPRERCHRASLILLEREEGKFLWIVDGVDLLPVASLLECLGVTAQVIANHLSISVQDRIFSPRRSPRPLRWKRCLLEWSVRSYHD